MIIVQDFSSGVGAFIVKGEMEGEEREEVFSWGFIFWSGNKVAASLSRKRSTVLLFYYQPEVWEQRKPICINPRLQ